MDKVSQVRNGRDWREAVAAVVAAEPVRLLHPNGVDEFHFYTLNRADLTYAIAHIFRLGGDREGQGRLGEMCHPPQTPRLEFRQAKTGEGLFAYYFTLSKVRHSRA